MSGKIDPYVGPRPFERKDRNVFFGRDIEANELVSLTTAHQVVLLYAQSGAGKTSLVKAGIIPLLVEEEKFDVLPPARVRDQIAGNVKTQEITNIYIFNALLSMSQDKDNDGVNQPLQANLARRSLAEFLKRRKQFSNRTDAHTPSVVVFDQFEEFFTSYPERWEERQLFFEQVRDALDENPLLRVIFSMREDFIAELDPYANILPEKLRTRFRMERLRKKTALWAVTKPLEAEDVANGGRRFAPGVAEELVDNLLKVRVKTQGVIKEVKGEFVEPLQLQIVCQALWGSLLPDDKVITEEHLKAYGDVDQALTTFYEDALQRTVEKTGAKAGVLRRWFERTLITPIGTRGIVFRGDKEAGGLPNQVVDELDNQRLIRVELRGGAQWYELTHDRLIETVKSSNQKWLIDRSGAEQTRQRLEDKAEAWASKGSGTEGLLDEVELLEAERWLASEEATELGYTKTLPALTKASKSAIEEKIRQVAEQQRQIRERAKLAKRLQWLAVTLAVVTILAIIVAGYALRLKRSADEQKQVAIENEQRLVIEQKQKEAAQQRAIEESMKAELEGARANAAEQETEMRKLEVEAQDSLAAGDYTAAESKYDELIKKYKDRDDHAAIANVWIKRGQIYHKQKKYDWAVQAYTNAIDLKVGKSGKFPDRDIGVIYTRLAEVYYDWERNKDALRNAEYARKIFAKWNLKKDQPPVSEADEIYDKIKERENNPFYSPPQ